MRLQEHAMDLAPAESCSITRHQDRPGTVGRVGALLGAADVNISAMNLARSAPRAEAYMVLALDDDVPPAVVDAIQRQRRHDRHVGDPPGQRPVTGGPVDRPARHAAHPRGPRRDARPAPPRRVGVDRREPVPGPGRDAAVSRRAAARRASRRAARASARLARPAGPRRPAARDRPLAAATTETAQAVADAIAAARWPTRGAFGARPIPVRPDPGSSRSRRATGRASPTRDRAALGRCPRDLAPPAPRSLGARR